MPAFANLTSHKLPAVDTDKNEIVLIRVPRDFDVETLKSLKSTAAFDLVAPADNDASDLLSLEVLASDGKQLRQARVSKRLVLTPAFQVPSEADFAASGQKILDAETIVPQQPAILKQRWIPFGVSESELKGSETTEIADPQPSEATTSKKRKSTEPSKEKKKHKKQK
jgi:hypothetical protein